MVLSFKYKIKMRFNYTYPEAKMSRHSAQILAVKNKQNSNHFLNLPTKF